MKPLHTVLAASAIALIAVGCATMPSPAELDAQALAAVRASFRDQGIAKVDRVKQDAAQAACSKEEEPDDSVKERLQAEAMATVKWPADGQYLGDWREGEKLAQNGRGMTWTDPSTATKDNGGNCYNCHQISAAEISFGTIGPSLLGYGKKLGVKDPASPASARVVQYTWAKIWNSKASVACSNMPRFGHAGLLDEQQIRHLMALLLDPKSPVNQ